MSENIKAERRRFAIAWAESMRLLGIDDPCAYTGGGRIDVTRNELWGNAGKAAKAKGLYAATTYFRDAGNSLRKMASQHAIIVRQTDQRFADSPDAGASSCICSRCGKPIGADEAPIRVWPESAAADLYEYRYHPSCVL